MKKVLVLPLLALLLTACDLSSIIQVSNKVEVSEETGEKKDITLIVSGTKNLLLKNREREEFANRTTISSIIAGTTTIKRSEGKITFYRPPEFGRAQLDELSNDEEHLGNYYFEQIIDFRAGPETNYDYIYLKNFMMRCSENDNKIYKNLRVALFDKDTFTDYYVFSYDSNGTLSKTEYNLDLNADGKLDEEVGYGFEEGESKLINYTTGAPSYMTDAYSSSVVTTEEIENDNIPEGKTLIPFNKALTIRIWAEGWEIENTDAMTGDMTVDIGIELEGHEI